LFKGTINEKALEELELVVQCSKSIRVSEANDADSAAADLARHTPQVKGYQGLSGLPLSGYYLDIECGYQGSYILNNF